MKSLAKYRSCLSSKEPLSFEDTLALPSGVKFFFTTLIPIRDPSNERVLRVASLSRDVSHYKQVENELRTEKANAEAANRAKSDFLASMSHEFRTPLNINLGMSEMLMATNLDSDQIEYAQGVQRSGKMLLSLVDDVLDIAKIESGKLSIERKPFSAQAVCENVILALRPQADAKGITLTLHVEGESPMVLGDEQRVSQVLVNFVSNAIKFTSKGSVTVELAFDDDQHALISNLRIAVIDIGAGIPAKDHKKLFARFSQTDTGHARRFGGTGLGLAISKQLVELMGGEIGFSSAANEGSTFWFRLQLPVVNQIVRHRKLKQEVLHDASGVYVPMRILAVDDSVESHPLLSAFLRRLGHDCTIASSGPDAIKAMMDGVKDPQRKAYDLVLMDMQMPQMDGLEATRILRQKGGYFSKVPIVALTANALKGQDNECYQAGMNDFVTKPISYAALRDVIEKWAPSTTQN